MYYAGIDIGSATAKCVLVDDAGHMAGSALEPTGVGLKTVAALVLEQAAAQAGVGPDDVQCVIGTGYGREIVPNKQRSVTEISCHARGAAALFPNTRFVIDIGGQDSKAIALGPNGAVMNFQMNDKCAAGTGRFLDVMARALEAPLAEFGPMALSAERPAAISSTCTVFAESEVISLLAQGEPVANIIAGLCQAVAERVQGLAARVGIQPEVTMTGGVAKNAAIVHMMQKRIGHAINVPEDPQIAGALGAALIARGAG